ncbi:MAG: nucleotidyl transferase AbiEii/AbiGii toxin family protein [bacterium]|nr:nucleotidyl transferase AbiEii/AbiGii toxin family protein [bacterium]
MFYNILDKKRIDLLPLFINLKKDFYLAGGTALALQIGHRDSVDFDFFKEGDIDTKKLFDDLKEIVKDHKILKIQEEYNTLSIIIDDNIKLSFFGYKYGLIDDIVNEENLKLASIKDIGCMKLSAITGRASNKDYIDIYYILQKIKLIDLLEKTSEKFSDLDRNLILKSLVYFDDIKVEPIMFKNNNFVDLKDIKEFFEEEVKKIKLN